MKIAVINGPNLNFLGIREPEIYGSATLGELEDEIKKFVETKENIEVQFFQSNIEGEIIDYLQKCHLEHVHGIVFNPGAFTHYSYALSDAIKSIAVPVIEVHLSNIHAREGFRSKSVTASSCVGIIGGLGFKGYQLAIDALIS